MSLNSPRAACYGETARPSPGPGLLTWIKASLCGKMSLHWWLSNSSNCCCCCSCRWDPPTQEAGSAPLLSCDFYMNIQYCNLRRNKRSVISACYDTKRQSSVTVCDSLCSKNKPLRAHSDQKMKANKNKVVSAAGCSGTFTQYFLIKMKKKKKY